MKTLFLLPFYAFLAIGNIYSQQKEVAFNRLHTRKLTLKGLSVSEIYRVSYAQVQEPYTFSNPSLQSELQLLINDSILKKTQFNSALAKFRDVSIIKNNVAAFLNSQESFGKKVRFLKEAQILALKHNMTDLFYSDNEINKEMKAGFLLLSLKPTDLETHLNKILVRLNKMTAPEKPTYTSTAELRKKLSSEKTASDKMVKNEIVAPEELIGDFIMEDRYYVLNVATHGLLKNQLVSKETVLSLGIPSKKLQFSQEKILIQNKQTKEMFLVDFKFIETFSISTITMPLG